MQLSWKSGLLERKQFGRALPFQVKLSDRSGFRQISKRGVRVMDKFDMLVIIVGCVSGIVLGTVILVDLVSEIRSKK